MKIKIIPFFIIILFLVFFGVFFKGLKNSNIYVPSYNFEKEIPSFTASLFDSNNDGILDEDDKTPTRITLYSPTVLWLDAITPAIFSGEVNLLAENGTFVPTANIPVQIQIIWTRNGTVALETVDVLTDPNGRYTVGQFLFPEDISVGPNSSYYVYAEVTEMFLHDSAVSEQIPVEVRANTTSGYSAGTQFRSEEILLVIPELIYRHLEKFLHNLDSFDQK